MTPYSIVFVCSGNRFRSPLAAAFVKRLTLGLPVSVESFGTLELGGGRVLPEARRIGLWCGIDLSEHRARCLYAGSMADADLVLGFEESHVRRAVVDGGAPRQSSFRVTELIALLQGITLEGFPDVVARARRTVDEAAALRGDHFPGTDVSSIPDPFGLRWSAYCDTAVKIRELSIDLVSSLFGPVNERAILPLPAKIPRP